MGRNDFIPLMQSLQKLMLVEGLREEKERVDKRWRKFVLLKKQLEAELIMISPSITVYSNVKKIACS
jgi:hypothetical protein